MFSAADIQAVLLGTGGGLGTMMAGIGVLRLCNSGAKRIAEIPQALNTAANELPMLRGELVELRKVVAADQSMIAMQVEQSGVLKAIRDDNAAMKEQFDLLHRELRILARKSEGLSND